MNNLQPILTYLNDSLLTLRGSQSNNVLRSVHEDTLCFHWFSFKSEIFCRVDDGTILKKMVKMNDTWIIINLLTAASLIQMYFWDSKVTWPNLKSSGLRPRFVSLNTSLKLNGKFCCIFTVCFLLLFKRFR